MRGNECFCRERRGWTLHQVQMLRPSVLDWDDPVGKRTWCHLGVRRGGEIQGWRERRMEGWKGGGILTSSIP